MKNKQSKISQNKHRYKEKNTAKNEQKKMKKTGITTEEDNFVFGYHAVVEAIQQGRGNKLFLQEDSKGEKIDKLKQLAQERSLPVKWVPKTKLEMWSNQGVHQGMVLAITAYEYLSLNELLEQVKVKTKTPFFLILDGLEDPHNFGSIFRTADATGVDGIIIPKHRSVGITPVVTKTSTGAVEYIPVARVTNLSQTIAKLKEQQFWIFGTDMTGIDYRNWDATGAIALIIGNEGKGISAGLKKEADELITIPMSGHVQSLNAGVAAGLLMYEAYRKRHPL